METSTYPVLVLCGRDLQKRDLLKVHDPEGKYPSKVLLPMLGKRVIDWQLEALLGSKHVEDVYLIGLREDDYPFNDQIHCIPFDTASPLQDKVIAGCEALSNIYPDLNYVIISTGDAPAITTTAVDMFFAELKNNPQVDILMSAVPEDMTSAVIPDHRRVVGQFLDQKVYIGEICAVRYDCLDDLNKEIDKITSWIRKLVRIRSRLTPLSLTSYLVTHPALGYSILKYFFSRPSFLGMMITYFRGKLTLAKAEQIFSLFWKTNFKVAVIPDVGLGMDMDLPEDYQKLANYIQNTVLSQT
jgi:CMP-2-keto-3-deoxyoctulosonic acid synthetase